jgi:very-short-patch-repair endonuclease
MIYLLVFIILIAILVAVFNSKIKEKEKLPYRKKNYLITEAETNFFKIIENVVGFDYYIFPQVTLSDLFFIKIRREDYQKYYNKINRKSVDFVLVDKKNMKPVLAIELDDSSHNNKSRKKRDSFVEEIFKDAEMPLLRIKCRGNYNTEEVKKMINEEINKYKK